MDHSFLMAALVIIIYMTIFFILAQILENNSIVDIGWGIGFIIVASFTAFLHPVWFPGKLIMNLFVLIWGLRLAIYIFLRNKGKGEDYRYKAWRDTWKRFILRSYFQIFILQGTLMFIVALPIIFVNRSDAAPLNIVNIAGIILFLTGYAFEVLGDYQLHLFKKNHANKGKIITVGLWRYTRHPNYFGEAVIWWGIACFALPYPGGWIVLISPVVITLMLRFVSGVTMLEKKYAGRADFEEYKKRTPAFIPWFPRNSR